MTETSALGDLIRESRLALGYSLGQLATKVGRTAATVRTWERGEAVPNEESRAALESVLDIDPGDLESLLPQSQPETAAGGDDSDARPKEDVIPADEGDALEIQTADAAELDEDAEGEESEPQPVGPESSEDEPEPAAAAGAVAAAATTAVTEREVVASADDEALDEAREDEAREDEESDEAPQEPEGDEATGATLGDDEPEASGAPPEAAAEPEVAEEPDGADSAPPVAPLTQGVPLDDEEVSMDDGDDTDDTLEGVAAVTPFEVDPALVDEPTEAVVVPVVAAATGVATQTRSVVTVSEPKEQRPRNPLRLFFDPQNRWLYWVRALFTIVVAVVLLFVLVWAAGELFDALGQVLDSIEPTEVDDGGIDALGRLKTLT